MPNPLDNITTDLRIAGKDPVFWAGFALLALLLGITGPFGSYNYLGLWDRIGMWVMVMGATGFAGTLTYFTLINVLPGTRAISVPLTILITSLPVCLVALLVDNLYLSVPITPARFWVDWQNLAPLTAIVVGLIALTRTGQDAARANAPASTPLTNLIPPAKRGPILSVSAEDHYVAITTTQGTHLVLMRFGDALAALTDTSGAQIHRSHWVAAQAVAARKRENGRLIVALHDGRTLPISRRFRDAFKPGHP